MAYQSIPGQFYDPFYGSAKSTPSNNVIQSIPGQYNPASNNYNAWPGGQVTSFPISPPTAPTQNTGGSTQTQNTGGSNGDIASWLRGHGYNNQSVIDQLTKDNPEWLRNAMNPPVSTGPSAEDLARQEEARIQGEIDKIYGPQMSALTGQEGTLKDFETQDVASAEARQKMLEGQRVGDYELAQKRLGSQQQEVVGASESARDQAIRGVNSLMKQIAARFGGMGSASRGASEIVGQELARGLTGTATALTKALGEFGLAGEQLALQAGKRKDELETWLSDATRQIQQQTKLGLDQITQRKGVIESEKGAAKLQLLREAKNLVDQVANTDKQLRVQLAGNLIQSAQEIAQRPLTMPEIAAIWTPVMTTQLAGLQALGTTITPTTSTVGTGLTGNLSGRRPEDEIG